MGQMRSNRLLRSGLLALLLVGCAETASPDASSDASPMDAFGDASPSDAGGDDVLDAGVSLDANALDDAPREDIAVPLDGGVSLDADAPTDAPREDIAAPRDVPTTDAGGPGPVPPLPEPMTQPDPCTTLTPTLRGTDGPDVLRGTPGRDVIFAGDGDDVIDGGGGDDVICGGNGEDRIMGGDGDDYIDGGADNDVIDGGAGDDTIHGRAGSDRIHGGAGNDVLSGDILDDDLYGDSGNDLLLGGHGNDYMHGGDGQDWLRGDTGRDTFVGGEGFDTASFATAMPPGQPLNELGGPVPNGVIVNLTERLDRDDLAWSELVAHGIPATDAQRAGVASGDGYREGVLGIEQVQGSHFDDVLVLADASQRAQGLYGNDTLRGPAGSALQGGPGADTCNGAACDAPGEPPGRVPGLFVFVDANSRDPGVVVLGSVGDARERLRVVVARSGAVSVLAEDGSAITVGAGCVHPNPAQMRLVTCTPPGPIHFLLAYLGDGDDRFVIQGGIPREATSHVSGGAGDDTLIGGEGEDVLFSGPNGRDTLTGNGGDDALLSESPAMDPATRGERYAGGADTLDGGPGNDQLVSDYPCGGHFFIGGPGIDIAGFRRSTGTRPPFYGINAQLGGPAAVRQTFHGRAFNPARCALDPWGTHIAGDLEVLEGADGDDNLFGNDQNNIIWAWGGRDTVLGYGGNDHLYGHEGDDEIYGGDGRDVLRGGGGFDRLFARDGVADQEIDCGEGGGRIETLDRNDPPAVRCSGAQP